MSLADRDRLRHLEYRADEYGLYAHHSTQAALRWLQAIRVAAEWRTRITPVAFERHKQAMKDQGITASMADDMFFQLSFEWRAAA